MENNSDSNSRVLIASTVLFVIALGVALFVIYQRRTSQPAVASSNQLSPAQPFTQQLISPPPPLISASAVSATPTPSPSPSPSPSPTATPAPQVKAEPARVALSTGPVATNLEAGNKRGPVIIRLTDGTTIKADEAWETSEGFWYRRSGMVTLLKRDQVKALETPPTPKSSPIPAPTLSPVQSR